MIYGVKKRCRTTCATRYSGERTVSSQVGLKKQVSETKKYHHIFSCSICWFLGLSSWTYSTSFGTGAAPEATPTQAPMGRMPLKVGLSNNESVKINTELLLSVCPSCLVTLLCRFRTLIFFAKHTVSNFKMGQLQEQQSPRLPRPSDAIYPTPATDY